MANERLSLSQRHMRGLTDSELCSEMTANGKLKKIAILTTTATTIALAVSLIINIVTENETAQTITQITNFASDIGALGSLMFLGAVGISSESAQEEAKTRGLIRN